MSHSFSFYSVDPRVLNFLCVIDVKVMPDQGAVFPSFSKKAEWPEMSVIVQTS